MRFARIVSSLRPPSHRPRGENFLPQSISTGKHPILKGNPADRLKALCLKARRSPVFTKNIRQGGRLDAEPSGDFVLAYRFHVSFCILSENIRQEKNRKSTPIEKIDVPESTKKSPTAPTVGLFGHALTGQGKENKAMEVYSNPPELSNIV